MFSPSLPKLCVKKKPRRSHLGLKKQLKTGTYTGSDAPTKRAQKGKQVKARFVGQMTTALALRLGHRIKWVLNMSSRMALLNWHTPTMWSTRGREFSVPCRPFPLNVLWLVMEMKSLFTAFLSRLHLLASNIVQLCPCPFEYLHFYSLLPRPPPWQTLKFCAHKSLLHPKVWHKVTRFNWLCVGTGGGTLLCPRV